MRFIRYLLLVLSAYSALTYAENTEEQSEKPEVQDIHEEEQKKLAQQAEEEQRDYSLLDNLFFENDVLRVYNHTAYQTDSVKNKFINGAADTLGLQDFFVSFGYGMEFKINSSHRVGYEYISSFPYDRGQVIRFFWTASF